jgi:hypothetical protein
LSNAETFSDFLDLIDFLFFDPNKADNLDRD